MLFHFSIKKGENPAFFPCRRKGRKTEKESSVSFMEGEAQSGRHQVSTTSRIKRECLSFATSLRESFRYIKAIFVVQAKTLTAKNKKEATEADLLASKTKVDAADEAEERKKRLDKTR